MNLLLVLILLVLFILALLLFWGVAIEPYRLTTTRHEVALPELPPAWENKTLALLADFQVGMVWHNLDTIRRAVAETLAARPAAVLIAGDFVHQPPENLEESLATALELLAPLLDAGLPVYGVLGNHDYGIGVSQEEGDGYAARVRAALERAGVVMLENDRVALEAPGAGDTLYLVGVGEHEFGHDDASRALAGLAADAPRVVMMHNPESFKALPAGAAPLAVAGHTHGGQIRLPALGDRYWLIPRGKNAARLAGWVLGGEREDAYGEAGNRLYITRGIGFSVVPMRLFSPPELTLFTLKRAAKRAER